MLKSHAMMAKPSSPSRIRWRSALDFFRHRHASLALGPHAAATIAPLLVACARTLGIPARTCSAFPFYIGNQRVDYHCWCEVWNGRAKEWQRVNLLSETLSYAQVELLVTKRPSSSKQLVLYRRRREKQVKSFIQDGCKFRLLSYRPRSSHPIPSSRQNAILKSL